jgi:hypothetical protein
MVMVEVETTLSYRYHLIAGEALKLKVLVVFSGCKKDAESRLWEPGAPQKMGDAPWRTDQEAGSKDPTCIAI